MDSKMNIVQSNLELEGNIARMGMFPGLVYVAEKQTGRVFSIRFGNFSGYHGETADEFGLRPGTRIRFQVNDDLQTVATAKILK